MILDNYFLKHNIGNFDYAMFRIAVANTLPTWRSEQLASDSVYTGEVPIAYIDYLENLVSETEV
jgi:hypothetical protein